MTRLKHIEGSRKFVAEAQAKLGDSFKVFLQKPIIPELIITIEIGETNAGFTNEEIRAVPRGKKLVILWN